MIDSIKQTIVNSLLEVYPGYAIYDEDIPQNFKEPSFLITLTNQEYSKRLNIKFKSDLSFDIAYFSDKGKTEVKKDCLRVQLNLLRNFDLIGNYRILNKQAVIVDNVLHITFDVRVSEIIIEENEKMNELITNIN